jgi:hypothetical protein
VTLSDEFRVNHRAASESLLRAAIEADYDTVDYELGQAQYFETEAMKHIKTPRQRALGMGLLHAVDLMRAVTEAQFNT